MQLFTKRVSLPWPSAYPVNLFVTRLVHIQVGSLGFAGRAGDNMASSCISRAARGIEFFETLRRQKRGN